MDPDSLGFTLSMAMECLEEGVIDEREVGAPLRFGDGGGRRADDAAIARREGFGDVLAEGVKRAAAADRPGAERFALQVKGLEMVPFEPRTQTNLALGYATAPVGPRYEICEHDWDYDTEVGWPHSLELVAHARHARALSDAEALATRRSRSYKALNTIWSGADALDLSIFAMAPTRLLGLHDLAELWRAVTGWETSSLRADALRREAQPPDADLQPCARACGPADDTLPDRFFDEPIRQGSGRACGSTATTSTSASASTTR